MTTALEYSKKHRELKDAIIKDIQTILGKKKIKFDEPFADEVNNDIYAVDKNSVYFNGTMERYPIYDLGVLDAILILNLIES